MIGSDRTTKFRSIFPYIKSEVIVLIIVVVKAVAYEGSNFKVHDFIHRLILKNIFIGVRTKITKKAKGIETNKIHSNIATIRYQGRFILNSSSTSILRPFGLAY